MKYEELLKPEIAEIAGRKFTVSAIPCDPAHAIWCDICKDFEKNLSPMSFTILPDDIIGRLMLYVFVKDNNEWVQIENEELRNKYIHGEENLIQLVLAMAKKNFSFFFTGRLFQWLKLLEGEE